MNFYVEVIVFSRICLCFFFKLFEPEIKGTLVVHDLRHCGGRKVFVACGGAGDI